MCRSLTVLILLSSLLALRASASLAAPAGDEQPAVAQLLPLAQMMQAKAIVERINLANPGWEAEAYPRFAMMTKEERKQLLGLKVPTEEETKSMKLERPETELRDDEEELPETFDPRTKWPECADVIGNIRDQSRCGDCWAVAAAGAFSDRLCIQSKGKMQVSISDIDTASCAQRGEDGCEGARDLSPAWDYFHKHGVVTGSNYSLKTGCKPYPFLPSDQAKEDYSTPRCTSRCTNRVYEKTYAQDRVFSDEPIALHSRYWKNVEKLIKTEVFKNGSVEVGFLVFSDFFYYKNGVYKHSWGSVEGGHAVRLVGWGVDEKTKTPYWLIGNSWGRKWGENGFFRIRRGTNEASIEGMVDPYAGSPLLVE